MSKKIAVAMSGGVDSSVTALLLKNQGHEVIGITGMMHEYAQSAVDNASKICEVIGIPHQSVNLKEEFKTNVINYFETTYKNGLTPNPCAVCNRTIKWGGLKKYAQDVLKADLFATGHYSKLINDNGRCKLLRAGDLSKDQIYMLFNLRQEDLAGTIFPLSDYKKTEVREIARKHNLPCAESPESQDVCFIQPPETTSGYLTKKFGEKEGNIIDIETGKILGNHKGFYNYTFGQRKGIKISSSNPLYIVNIDPDSNTIYVGPRELTYTQELQVNNINWQQEEFINQEFQSLVKIRYNSPAKKALVIPQNNNSVTVKFTNPVFAITPGQAAVFYHPEEEYLIGGGWIHV